MEGEQQGRCRGKLQKAKSLELRSQLIRRSDKSVKLNSMEAILLCCIHIGSLVVDENNLFDERPR
jgi:hypothetical protein